MKGHGQHFSKALLAYNNAVDGWTMIKLGTEVPHIKMM